MSEEKITSNPEDQGVDNEKEQVLESETSRSVPRKHIEKRPSLLDRLMRRGSETKEKENSTPPALETEDELPPLSDLKLVGYKATTRRRLLGSELAHNIRNLVPRRLQLASEWDLVYSMEQDGISLRSLYRNNDRDQQVAQMKRQRKTADTGYASLVVNSMVGGHGYHNEIRRPVGYVLVIQDSTGAIFGSYLNENLRLMEHKRYYGNGECFLWKCERTGDGSMRFKAFVYTGINDNIIYSNSQFIAIGSSGGHNGIWIDKLLCSGVSAYCETFGNEVLCGSSHTGGPPPHSKEGRFEIIGLEVWRIGDP
jgi:hypothetical protein